MTQSPPPSLRIAIDGPAGAGKSTVAHQVARALGYTYIDTGALYRAVAWAVLDREVDPQDADAVAALAEHLDLKLLPGGTAATRVFADGRDITEMIRTPAVSNLTSALSALPRVRRRLVTLQKEMGNDGGVVMEGRDIGTVVLPDAEVKVFLTASLEQRVERRQKELAGRGVSLAREQLTQDIAARDARDGSRDVAPMRPAPDAVVLDSDQLNAEQVVERILQLHEEARRRVH